MCTIVGTYTRTYFLICKLFVNNEIPGHKDRVSECGVKIMDISIRNVTCYYCTSRDILQLSRLLHYLSRILY